MNVSLYLRSYLGRFSRAEQKLSWLNDEFSKSSRGRSQVATKPIQSPHLLGPNCTFGSFSWWAYFYVGMNAPGAPSIETRECYEIFGRSSDCLSDDYFSFLIGMLTRMHAWSLQMDMDMKIP
jgi:hypothetical protein